MRADPPNETHPSVEVLLVDDYRTMPPLGKLERFRALTRPKHELALAEAHRRRPSANGERWRRRLSLGGHILLGVLLFVLVEGSWVLWVHAPSRMDVEDRLLYLHWQMLFELSPHGLFMRSLCIAGIGILWQLGVKLSQGRFGRPLLVAAWVATFAFGGWYAERWKAFCAVVTNRVDRVFNEVERGGASGRWAGMYGVADLAGHLTAITPSGEFARYGWQCIGTRNLAWGHVLEDGPFLRLVFEEAHPFGRIEESAMRYAPIRANCRKAPADRCYNQLLGMAEVQTALIHPDGMRAKSLRGLGWWPDERQLAELRRPFERILALHPVIARAHAVEQRPRPAVSHPYSADLKRGTLDIGTREGVATGMMFCPADRSSLMIWSWLVITAPREKDSDFIAQDWSGDDLKDGTAVQLCSEE